MDIRFKPVFLLLFGLVLFGSICYAQFSDLATDRFGTRVLFSSSYSLTAEAAQNWEKLFQASQTGVSTFKVIEPPPPAPPMLGPEPTFFRLVQPEMSSDGNVVAWTSHRNCIGGSACAFYERFAGTITGPGNQQRGRLGIGRISANARWALFYDVEIPAKSAFLDLASNKEYTLPQNSFKTAGVGRRIVAADGTAVIAALEPGLHLLRPGAAVQLIPGPPSTSEVVIDDNARFAVYQTDSDVPSIGLVDLYTNENFPAVFAYEGCYHPALTEDGTTMLFLSAANWEAKNDRKKVQVWLMDLMRGTLRQLTSDQDGIAEATISGDGMVVFATTLGGRMLRIDVPTGEAGQLIAQTPWSIYSAVFTNPGARVQLPGRGLQNAVVVVNGEEVPAVSSTAEMLEFDMPATAPAGQGTIELRAKDSPFQPQKLTLTVEVVH